VREIDHLSSTNTIPSLSSLPPCRPNFRAIEDAMTDYSRMAALIQFARIEGTNLTFHEFVGVPMSENTLNHNSYRDVRW
jgi:hypothetical protein